MLYSNDCYLKHTCAKYMRQQCVSDSFCIKLFKMDKLYSLGMLSDVQRQHKLLHPDADGTDREQFLKLKQIEDTITDFVSQGRNLYLHSKNCGNGKTSWAVRFLQRYVQNIWPDSDIRCRILFVSVPEFFLKLKDNISQQNEYIQYVKEVVDDCDLVVWDDIGTKVGTEFEVENLLSIIDRRINNGKSNIFTSNMGPKQLNERLGERLYSRIVNTSIQVELFGLDKRGFSI